MAKANDRTIAARYARAILELAVQQRETDPVAADLQQLAEAAASEAEFRHFLKNPLLPRDAKLAAMQAVLSKGRAHALTQRFIERLTLNNRLALLPLIASIYAEYLSELRNEVNVTATSAAPLSSADARALEQALAQALGKNVRITADINPDLIGGVVLKIGDMRLDYSVAGQLTRLGDTLKSAPLPKAA